MRGILCVIICTSVIASAICQEPQRTGLFGLGPLSESNDAIADERGGEPLETERDAFTPATRTVGKYRSILESSYSFIDNRHNFETHSFPETLYRFGITERVELRLGWNFEAGGSGNAVTSVEGLTGLEGAGIERESKMLYGIKTMVTAQRIWVPESSLIVQGYTPTSGQDTNTQGVVGYVFGWKLPKRWKLDTSLRYGTAASAGDHFEIWAPSTVLRVPLGEKWAVHGEYFGLFSLQKETNFSQHYFSTGMHYLITNNLEVGFRVGWGLNEQSSPFFSNVGVGWRF